MNILERANRFAIGVWMALCQPSAIELLNILAPILPSGLLWLQTASAAVVGDG